MLKLFPENSATTISICGKTTAVLQLALVEPLLIDTLLELADITSRNQVSITP